MTTPAADGPVWRDRGAIIAQQQARIAELEAELAELRSALERTESNFRLAVQGKPVRDMAETLAENRAALAQGEP